MQYLKYLRIHKNIYFYLNKILPDKTVIYYFYDAQTTQTTYPDELNVYNT